MKLLTKILLGVLVAVACPVYGQSVFNKYGPVAGIQKSTGSTYQNTAAASSDVIGLWSGCSGSNFLRGDGTCAVPAGTGVTSVSQTVPAGFAVTGSPVTGAGTLAISYDTGQTANLFLATPNGSTGAISERAIVGADVPPTNLATTTNGGVLSTSILAGTNGGTSNGFMSFTGPTTSLKTFTLPNASASILTSNAAVTVAQGGTGVATLTNHGVLLGQGTSNVSTVAAMATDTVLMGVASADPVAVAVNNCGSSTTALSYSTSTHTFGCQTISTGTGSVTSVTAGTGLTASPNPIISTGTVSVDQTSSLTWTGTETFSTNQTMFSTAASSFNPLAVCANGLATLNRCWAWRIGGGADLILSAADNSGVPGIGIVFDVVRSGAAITGINIGNTTDYPTVTMPAFVSIVPNGSSAAPLTLDQLGAFATYMQFKNSGTTRGYIGVEPGSGSLCTGDAAGDMCLRTTGGALRASLDNGVTSMPLVAAGTFTMTYNGFTSPPGLTATYTQAGKMVTLIIPGSAVAASNATTFTATGIPAAIQPAQAQMLGMFASLCEDNSVIGGFTCGASISGGTITFSKNNSPSGWTNSNQKGITTNLTVTYLLN